MVGARLAGSDSDDAVAGEERRSCFEGQTSPCNLPSLGKLTEVQCSICTRQESRGGSEQQVSCGINHLRPGASTACVRDLHDAS